MTLYFNGKIATMETKDEFYDCMIVDEEKIVKLGSYSELSINFDSEVVDLKSKLVLPGFLDPHSHFMLTTILLNYQDMSHNSEGELVTSIEQLIERFKQYENDTNNNHIVGLNCDSENFLESRELTRYDLDQVSTTKAVVAVHPSGHMGCFNSKAIEILGLTDDVEDMDGGKYFKEDGKLTGFCQEDAFTKHIFDFMESPQDEEMKKAIDKCTNLYLSNGYVAAQEGLLSELSYKLAIEANEKKLFNFDIFMMPKIKSDEAVGLKSNGYKYMEKKNNLIYQAEKMFLDGSSGGRTALLSESYLPVDSDLTDSNFGISMMSDDEVLDNMLYCLENKIQFLTHANGDAAIDQYIKCLKKAKEKFNVDVRPVLIHSQITRKDQFKDLSELKVIPSFYSAHIYYFLETHVKNLGIKRAGDISDVGEAIKHNMIYTDHQDTPVVLPNVFISLDCMVNRTSKKGLNLTSGIDLFDALKAYTSNSAYAYFSEDKRGLIKEGFKSDFIILDEDIFSIDTHKIKDVKVLKTYINNKLVYDKV